MTMESKVVSLESFRKKPVSTNCSGHWIGPGWKDMFAYVLNIPDSEPIWPGDAADLFFPDLFALRMSGPGLYVLDNYVHEHMRREILRLCFGDVSALDYMEQDIKFYCRMEASFADIFCDGCEDELDTLNSELLLTQEYEPPEDIGS